MLAKRNTTTKPSNGVSKTMGIAEKGGVDRLSYSYTAIIRRVADRRKTLIAHEPTIEARLVSECCYNIDLRLLLLALLASIRGRSTNERAS